MPRGAGCGRCVQVLSKHIRFGFISALVQHICRNGTAPAAKLIYAHKAIAIAI